MPYADTMATVRSWAEDRSIRLWAIVAGDLAPAALAGLSAGIDAARRDGAVVALVAGGAAASSVAERALADVVVDGPVPPSPFGLLAALQTVGVADVRAMGVLGGSRDVLVAGHRAGCGSVVGIASTPGARLALLAAQPDRIVAPADFAALDAELFSSGRAHRERVLLNPGPAVVSDRIHRAVAGPDLCHREPEYTALFRRIRTKLRRVGGVDDGWQLALIAGSGTAAMEAMTGASTRGGRKLLVCRNGIYGERLVTIATRLGIETVSVDAPETEPISPVDVAAALDDDPSIDAVAVVHHETTTGLLNPVHEIAAEAKRRDVRVLVDAISSLGAERLELAGSGIDMVACTSNKCLHGLPGTAFVLLSPVGAARAAESPRRSLYLDIAGYLEAEGRDSVPFTPAVPAAYGLEAALDELLDEGLEHRRAAYRARVALLDDAFKRLGLEPCVAAPHRSSSVRSLRLPPGVSYATLHDAVKRDGYVIYAGLGDAAKTTFRVCTLGALKPEVLAGFVDSLGRAIAGARLAGVASRLGADGGRTPSQEAERA